MQTCRYQLDVEHRRPDIAGGIHKDRIGDKLPGTRSTVIAELDPYRSRLAPEPGQSQLVRRVVVGGFTNLGANIARREINRLD